MRDCETSARDVDALTTFYRETNGTHWLYQTRWLQGDPCNQKWWGITCDYRKATFSRTTWGDVTELFFYRDLQGRIPKEIGMLSSLTSLVLRGDPYDDEKVLHGPIPPELGELKALTVLDLSENDLSGSIPDELGLLSSLTSLNLYDTGLNGSIPASMGSLSNLRIMDLPLNEISGSIPPTLGALGSLETLSLHDNRLSGDLPAELGNLASLETLDIAENFLTGTIPDELGNLECADDLSYSSRVDIDARRNLLRGPIPLSWCNCTTRLRLYPQRQDEEVGYGLIGSLCIPAGCSRTEVGGVTMRCS